MNYADYYSGGGGGGYQPPQTPYGQHPYQQGDFGGGMNERRYGSYGMPGGFGTHSQGGYDQWRPRWQEGMPPQPGYQIPGMQQRRYKRRGQKGNYKYQPYPGGNVAYGKYQPYLGNKAFDGGMPPYQQAVYKNPYAY